MKIRKRPLKTPGQQRSLRPPKVALQLTKEGKLAFSIYTYTHGLKEKGDDLYELVDFMGELDVLVECDGVPISPTMILKIYCKLDGSQARAARRHAALAAARARSPILS